MPPVMTMADWLPVLTVWKVEKTICRSGSWFTTGVSRFMALPGMLTRV